MSMQEIEVLRQQKRELENTLVEIDQGIKIGNRVEINDQLNAIGNKISEMEFELKMQEQTAQIEAQHEEQAKEVAKSNAYVLDTLEVEGITMSQLSASATAYEILREAVQQVLNNQTQKLLDQLKAVKEESAKTIAELQKQNEMSSEALQLKTEQYNALRNDYNAIVDENRDLATKRDAAAAELEAAKGEIDRLNDQVQDLRTEIAIGAKSAVRVTNVEGAGDLAAKIAAYKQSLPAIYDVQPLDTKGSRFSAKLAETGEPIEFGWLEKNKYREVTAEQADTFRTEYLAKQSTEAEEEHNQEDTNGVEIVETEVSSFQNEEDDHSTTIGLVESTPEMVGDTVTREEFEKLKARVAELEVRPFTWQ